MQSSIRLLLVALAAYLPGVALAHFMTQPYLLPVPFWMYAYGCATTLVVTFAVLGYFSATDTRATVVRTWDMPDGLGWAAVGRAALFALQLLALAWLLFTISTALVGSMVTTDNIAMVLFWVVFLLAFVYLTVFIGNLYELINPWWTLISWMEKLGLDFTRVRIPYPKWLGYYPAFLFYVYVIWLELFALPNPRTLAWSLITYSAINFGASWLFGKAAWFRFGEMFSVFFRMVGTLAPVEYQPAAEQGRWHMRLRAPFIGALKERPEHMGLVLFVLFMLSSTTYDAIHDTEMWLNVYWRHLIIWTQPLWGGDMNKSQAGLMEWYTIFKRGSMLLSPFIYLALYMLVMWWTKAITKTRLSVTTLALDFITTLVPIAFVYSISHYYTLLLLEVQRLPALFNDPFNRGWNLFDVERTKLAYLDMGTVWHTQVALILIGHVVSVYLAHAVALRVFPTKRQAILSQIPMLLLMVAYTAIGLYVLSLPLGIRQLREG
jgi:hypothetical protein